MKKHSGGCACGKVRYHSIGQPVKTGLCHCRYCQLRTGSAFGISVYFKKENLKIEFGDLKKYTFTTENGNTFVLLQLNKLPVKESQLHLILFS